jgi:hypothetical protein
MSRLVRRAKRLATGVAVAGALSVAVAGTADAAPALFTSAPRVGAHFKCARASKVLSRIEHTESQISAGLPGLTKRHQAAKFHGRSKQANRLQRQIARLESPQLKQQLTKAAQAIEAKCHVSPPSSSGTST